MSNLIVLCSSDGGWYLAAYDRGRNDWRSFRVDRIAAARSAGKFRSQRTLPAGDASEFVRASIEHMSASHAIEVVVDAGETVVRSNIGRWSEIEPIDDSHCMVRMTSDSFDWPAMALGSIGADFTVIAPPELRDHIREWGHRFTRVGGDR